MTAIERQRELLAKATPGPWSETCGLIKHYVAMGDFQSFALQELSPVDGRDVPAHADAALIVAAVNDRAALLDVVEAVEEALAAVKAYQDLPEGPGPTKAEVEEAWERLDARQGRAFDTLDAALDRLHEQPGWAP